MKPFVFLVAASFLLGCSRTVTEVEPNDHFTQATPIKSDCTVHGTIATAGDIDMYRLDVSQDGGALSLRLGGIRDIDFVISIQDKDRQEIKRIDETAVGGDEEALDIGVDKGTYYIALSNKNAAAANPTQVYSLQVKVEAGAGREREPNDKPLSANILEPGGVIRGHYFPSKNLLAPDKDFIEDDWYRVRVGKVGTYVLNADVSEVPKIDPVLEIYDANSYRIKELDGSGAGTPVTLRNFGVHGPADFYLRLFSRNHAGNPDVPYELLTELLPYEGKTELEPNDQRQDATPFTEDSMSGNIFPAGDVDWYKISISSDAKQILRAELSAMPDMDLQLTFADELGNPRLVIDNMAKEQTEVLTGIGVGKGDYYLVVSEKTKKASNGRRAYTLSKSLVPLQPGLEYESNDSSATAQQIKIGDSLDGYIAPKGDVDWFEFNVYKKGILSAEITGVLNVRMTAALYDQDSRQLRAETAKKPGDSIAFDKDLEAGTYSIKLQAAGPDENNVRDKYTLRLKMR